MKTLVLPLVATAALLVAAPVQAACYTVYSGKNVVFRSIQAPVDLSRTLHETVPRRFGFGASMVIADSTDGCLSMDERVVARAASTTEARRGSSGGARAPGVQRYLDANSQPIRSEVGGTP